MDIRPGQNVRIVTDVDLDKERITVKGSIVYDVQGTTILLAQTDPPVLKSMLGKEIAVTYLTTEKGKTVRDGFPGKITEFVDYTLSSGTPVKALKVEPTGEPKRYNVRMFYRVSPTGRSGIAMSIHGSPVNLLDLSLGGAKISYDPSLKLHEDTMAKTSLAMNEKIYDLEARILRTWDGASEGFDHGLMFAAIEFQVVTKAFEQVLSQKIRDIEREAAGPYSL
jgi:hypothetical protein